MNDRGTPPSDDVAVPAPAGSGDAPTPGPWLWALREGWRLARRRPGLWLGYALLLTVMSASAGGELWQQQNTSIHVRIAELLGVLAGTVLAPSAMWFLVRVQAGDLAGRPVQGSEALLWTLLRLRRWVLFSVLAGAVSLALFFVTLILLGTASQLLGVPASSWSPSASSMLIGFVAFGVSLRLGNASTYYIVLGDRFWISLRKAYEESGRQWGAYLAPAILHTLPVFYWVAWIMSGFAHDAAEPVAGFRWASIAMHSVLPVVRATWLHLWLRHGEGADLAGFEREL